jgi:hypothetical protein
MESQKNNNLLALLKENSDFYLVNCCFNEKGPENGDLVFKIMFGE